MSKLRNKVPELLEKLYGGKDKIPAQEVIAQATGLSQTTVSRWIGQKIDRFDAPVLEQWARFFGVSAGDLIYFENEDEWIKEK